MVLIPILASVRKDLLEMGRNVQVTKLIINNYLTSSSIISKIIKVNFCYLPKLKAEAEQEQGP